MLSFNPPSTASFKKMPQEMKSTYQGHNKERIKSIHWFETIAKKIDESYLSHEYLRRELKSAALIFLEEQIKKNEYKGKEAEKGWFTGSTLVSLFRGEKGLNISEKNPLDEIDKLIYLHKLYVFVKEQNFSNDFEEIEAVLRQVKQKNTSYFKGLHKPSNNFLKQANESDLLKDYVEKKKGMELNKDRLKYIYLGQLVEETCHYLEEITYENAVKQRNINFGILLFTAIKIANSYKGSVVNNNPKKREGRIYSTGSDLYTIIIEIFGIDSLDDISYEDKKTTLTELKNHLADLIKNNRCSEELNMTDLKSFQKELQDIILDLKPDEKNSSTTEKVMTKAIGGIAKLSLPMLFSRFTVTFSWGFFASSPVLYLASIGTAFALSGIASSLFYYVIDKCSEKLSQEIIRKFFDEPEQGFKYFLENEPESTREKMLAWVNAVLDLPNNIVSEKEKEMITKITGISLNNEHKLVANI